MKLFGSSAICYRYDVPLALCLFRTVSCEEQGFPTEMNADNLYGCKFQLSISKSSVRNLPWARIYLEKSFKCHCIKLGSLFCSAACLEKFTYMYIFAHRKIFPYFPGKTFLDAYSGFFTQGNEY